MLTSLAAYRSQRINKSIFSCTHSSGSRYSSSSVIGGEEPGRLLSAMMCCSVMSVCVAVSDIRESVGGVGNLRFGVRRRTCTMIGSLAARKASTA